jgi:hypothetical protein
MACIFMCFVGVLFKIVMFEGHSASQFNSRNQYTFSSYTYFCLLLYRTTLLPNIIFYIYVTIIDTLMPEAT